MVPRVGQRIGPYEILGRLGSGGMGLVFSAWDARLQRDVAIKLLREEYATPTMRSRFLQEARAASGLNHPNICTIFDIGEVSGDPFLVMELLKGETLRARISAKGKLPSEDIHRIAAEVLDALATAHARGVIHRDIKPANIILVNKPGGGFQAKVLDFGLAKVELNDEESTRFDLTTIGTTVGTVSYMSPEQARGEAIDARSDLFSLGSVLYEAATGELPFQGATSALIFVELLGKVPQPIRQQNPAIPKDLDRIISKLLAKSRSDRFQSATAALEALQSVTQRKATLGGISLWGNKGGSSKGRPEPSAPAPRPESLGPEISPRISDPPAGAATSRPNGDTGTVLRPARRAPDPFAQRPAGSAPPPSPAGDRTSLPPAVPETPPPPARQTQQTMGTVVLRPVKPEPARPSPLRDGLAPGSSAESNLGGSPIPHPEEASGPSDLPLAPSGLQNGSGFPVIDYRDETPATSIAPAPRNVIFADAAPGAVPAFAGTPAPPQIVAVPASRSRAFVWGLGALATLLCAALSWYFLYRRQPVVDAGPITVVLASMQNSTGDSTLSGIVSTGLRFATEQSPHLAVRSHEDYLSGLRIAAPGVSGEISLAQARRAAQAVGAGVLVFGDLHNEGAAFVLTLHTYDVATGSRTSEFSETSSSREQIPDALDRLASDLRSTLGEASDSIGRTAFPLSKEATSNIDAIEAFASGASFQAAGNTNEAMLAFQRSVSLEPHFTQAWLCLADLYREQHAEVASARAATQAQASSGNASPRTQWLAEAGAAINAAEDYGRATDPLNRLLAVYPRDLDALNHLALAELLGGKFSDAQITADRALQLFRYDPQATAQEELALIAQGRPEAVASVETLAEAAGLAHPGIVALAAAASSTNPQMLLVSADPATARAIPPAIAASLLDSAGHFSEASARWQELTDVARSTPELLSAVAYSDGVSALHRALASDCNTALPLAQTSQSLPSGALATFSAGEAQALCGDVEGARRSLATLNGAYAPGSAAQAYLIPDLAATIAWKAGDAPGALRTLDAARQYDPMSLTAYLRGLVEISAHQPHLSIVQFQAMLSHRGPTTLFNPEVYPLAQLGLGRAYAASGDTANSSVAYGRFLDLWGSADPGIAAVIEARAQAHP